MILFVTIKIGNWRKHHLLDRVCQTTKEFLDFEITQKMSMSNVNTQLLLRFFYLPWTMWTMFSKEKRKQYQLWKKDVTECHEDAIDCTNDSKELLKHFLTFFVCLNTWVEG